MRITIQALIEGADGQPPRAETIGTLEHDAVPASGLGLFLGETHALLRQLQAVLLREQVSQFLDRAALCRRCGARLATKDSKVVIYRTAFGKARLDSPRLYSRCSGCGARASTQASLSPLAEALPERTHPQWLWLQSRYAVVVEVRRQPISTSRAEGSVAVIANARMAKRRRMRWSPRGAHYVATVRAAVLDGQLHDLTTMRFAA